MSNLIEHLETHLGQIVGGWDRDADGNKSPIQVVHFEKCPMPGARVLTTLGLSKFALGYRDGSRRLRQELVMMCREADGYRNLPGILHDVALEALSKDRACAVGDVLGPRGELVTGSPLEALYVTLPVYLPETFHIFKGDEYSIVFAWLVPITASEANLVRSKGRIAFEDVLEKFDPDMLDFARPSIA